jgi:O-methyltransferase involved in polyketide biosynthesis
MKVHHTAAFTAMWRHMADVDGHSVKQIKFPMNFIGYILGKLDPNSVETIKQRTEAIDLIIKKIKPACIVDIGAGHSSRQKQFKGVRFYSLDLPYFSSRNKKIIPFDISKDEINIDVKNAIFIVEGVTMYLQEKDVMRLLKQIKKYKGRLLIDFFSRDFSSREKNLREKIYKIIFKFIIGKKHLFDFRIINIGHGKRLLRKSGYKNARYIPYNLDRTLDALFYAEL